MHNERSGGNISLPQIAASAAGRPNNRGEGAKKKKKERGLAFLAGFKDGAQPGRHSFPRPWALHMETSQGRREDGGGEGVVVVGWVGVWVTSQPPPPQKKTVTKTNYPPPSWTVSLLFLTPISLPCILLFFKTRVNDSSKQVTQLIINSLQKSLVINTAVKTDMKVIMTVIHLRNQLVINFWR